MINKFPLLKKSDYIIYAIVFILIYLLNRFNFFIIDDCRYMFISGTDYVPITSFLDTIKSQCNDYLHINGRFILHVIIQYFCGVLGMGVFSIINAVVFTIFLANIVALLRRFNGYHISDNIAVLVGLFLFIPIPGTVFWGNISFSVNYLWTACAISIFLNLYYRLKETECSKSTFKNVMIFLFALLCGSLQESFSIGISGALFLYYTFNLRKLRGPIAWLVIGFLLGSCVLILAPGNFVRFFREGGDVASIRIVDILSHMIGVLLIVKTTILLLIVIIILWIKQRVMVKSLLRDNVILVIAIIINIAFASLVAMKGAHQLMCVELFSMILLFRIGYTILNKFISRYDKRIAIVFSCVMLALYIPIYGVRQELYNTHETLIYKARNTTTGVVNGKEYTLLTMSIWDFFNKYTYQAIYTSSSNHYDGVWGKAQLDWLSVYITRGRNIYLISAVLPQSVEYIVGQYNGRGKDVSIAYSHEYKFVTIRVPASLKHEDLRFDVYTEPTLLGNLRNKILGRNISLNKTNPSVEIITNFEDSDYRYYTISNHRNIPIRRVAVYELTQGVERLIDNIEMPAWSD